MTIGLMVGIILSILFLAIDLFLYIRYGDGKDCQTFSRAVWQYSQKHRWIILAYCALCIGIGWHLFS